MFFTINNLTFKYNKQTNKQTRFALEIDHLKITDGIVAVIGENGAGKSTFFKCLQGFLQPSSGSILMDEGLENFSSVQVFQSEQSFEYANLREWIEFQGLLRGIHVSKSIIASCLQKSHLQGKEKLLVSKLSGGQQRKLNLVCAQLGDPDLLILDEPTTGLDQEARKDFWETVKKSRTDNHNILLFSSHYMDEVEDNADQVILLSQGKVVACGTPQQLITALKVEYVATIPCSLKKQLDTEEFYFIEGNQQVIYISDTDKFFSTHGDAQHLIREGIHLRKPNMSDVYTLHYKEGKNA